MARGDLGVERPPQVPKAVPVSPLARMMPLAMLVAAVGMMAVYFTSGSATMRNPMYMFFPVMMLSSVLGSLAYGARGAGRSAELNRDRQNYLRYLDTLDSGIACTTDDQRRSLSWSHPDPEDLWTLAGGRRMWERGPEEADFCRVRVGRGHQALSTRLVTPDLGPADELDPVTVSAMQRLVRQRSVVADVPVAVALRAYSAVTIVGDAERTRALLRAMVCQIALLHGPDHVAIAVVHGARTRKEWEWLKWLPHHQHSCKRDAIGPARLVYSSVRQAVKDAVPPDGAPPRHVVVILDGRESTGPEQVVSADNVTVVGIAGALDDTAIAHSLRLHVAADSLTIQGDDGGDDVVGHPDALTLGQATTCARRLAPYRPAVVSARDSQPMPPSGWLGLMGIDDTTHIDPDRRWATGSGHIRPVPIGVSEDGRPVYLDINEAARNGVGPHGLCVGATGSGKSEFLRTLALGMITVHSPDVLNLILVDFKGGATFLGLERARHVAAVITNLADEAHLVSRMNEALSGEMNRRQELLRAAGNFANVFEYESARSRGTVMPPLPALFILVDEFSELLSQHPDFAELFVAVGRLGRSLGMHLLLASQRLDDGRLRGLDTHLSYRICLKTFSANESRAVLGVPDAYHLPSSPGAAYLKTAPGDLVRFQTAFVSGPGGGPPGESPATRTTRPMLFTAAAVVPANDGIDRVGRPAAPTRSVLDTVLDRLAGRGTPAHRVWLPPLSESPTLDTLAGSASQRPLMIPIGLVDNPFEQRRDLLVAQLAGAAGNVAIAGAPRSGKSTAVRTLLMGLAENHDPAEVGFYCLDFGGGALSALRGLPHVGSVAGRSDVDLCRRTVAVMESVLCAREARFRRLGLDSMADFRRRRAARDTDVVDDPYGDVFLVVDGWATLRQEFEGLEGPIAAIAARGLSYGVHVVVTASRWAELRPALKDQIATRIELRLGDPADSEMDRKSARQLMRRPPGRGITSTGREMVIALPRWDGKSTAEGLGEAIDAHTERVRQRWNDRCAPPVELLPAHVAYHELPATPHLLLGLGELELRPIAVDLAEHCHLLVLGEAGCGKTAVLRLLCHVLTRTGSPEEVRLEIVDFRRTLLGVVESDHLAGYAMSPASLTSRVRSMLDTLNARMPDENITQQQLRTRSWWSGPEIYLVIDDYDLAAGSTGNPLTPLADLLPHARDIGLHLVVARRSGGAARAMFDPVLTRLREQGCMGLMMSASAEEGVLLGSVRPSRLPPGRGTLITRGDPDQIIQVAWIDPP
jgi:S-DNA-T family DNA segregation ATPase FtsK/SpoIIIE